MSQHDYPSPSERPAREDLFIVAWPKERPRFFFVFTPSQVSQALRTAGVWASDPENEFTWQAAAEVSSQIVKHATTNIPH